MRQSKTNMLFCSDFDSLVPHCAICDVFVLHEALLGFKPQHMLNTAAALRRCLACGAQALCEVLWGLYDVLHDGGGCMDYWTMELPCKGLVCESSGRRLHPSLSFFLVLSIGRCHCLRHKHPMFVRRAFAWASESLQNMSRHSCKGLRFVCFSWCGHCFCCASVCWLGPVSNEHVGQCGFRAQARAMLQPMPDYVGSAGTCGVGLQAAVEWGCGPGVVGGCMPACHGSAAA